MSAASSKLFPLSLAGYWSLLGCSDVGPRVFFAEPYDAEGECLGDYEAVGLVQADRLPSDCASTCLEISGTLYVASVCPPYPDSATWVSPEDDAECAAALVAESCLAEDSASAPSLE